MAEHRATPENWRFQEQWAARGDEDSDCFLELRDRLAAAEQRISELENAKETQRVGMLDVYQHLDRLKTKHESNWSRIVKLEDPGAMRVLAWFDDRSPAFLECAAGAGRIA